MTSTESRIAVPFGAGELRLPGSCRSRRRVLRGSGLLLLAVLSACGGGGAGQAPAPGSGFGSVPSLRGATVLLIPVQRRVGVGSEADAELSFALRARGDDVEWIAPEEIRRLTEQSVMEVPIDRLPVDIFFRAQVDRIGDPIYGSLRRLAALTDAGVALIPLAVSAREANEERPEGIEVMATLIDVRSGRVLWTGTEEGVGDPGNPGTLAMAMESLARTLYP